MSGSNGETRNEKKVPKIEIIEEEKNDKHLGQEEEESLQVIEVVITDMYTPCAL